MDWRNSEGYPDPTPYEALKAVRVYHPIVYICSPFAGDIKRNIERARGYCRLAVSQGYIPLAPHLHYPQFMDDGDPAQRKLGLWFALILLAKCDELWVFSERISSGMSAEITKAERRGMPIRYFDSKGEEVGKCTI
ncbi:MAG: DUF4406 domain-containing protein [Syntrophomonadaceae bacterium]|nr:DUF4406 domain-containing protein [Syntrophomonadaceae bacterium]